MGTTLIDGKEYEYFIWDNEYLCNETDSIGFRVYVEEEETKNYGTAYNNDENKLFKENNIDIEYYYSDSALQKHASSLLFAVASSGSFHCVIPLEKLEDFIYLHSSNHFICLNAAIDYLLIKTYFEMNRHYDIIEIWNSIVDQSRIHDLFILNYLINLAIDDSRSDLHDFETIVNDYTGIKISSSYCKRKYKESYQSKWFPSTPGERIPPYKDINACTAIRDGIILKKTYDKMIVIANEIIDKYKNEMFKDAHILYGPLSEGIQIKGSIALLDVTKNGITIDFEGVNEVKRALTEKYNEACSFLMSNPKYDGLFNLKVANGSKIIPGKDDNGKPSIVQSRLDEILKQCAEEISNDYNIDVTIPYVSKNKISQSTKAWNEYVQYHDFIKHWTIMEQSNHFINFLTHLKSDKANPEYIHLVRNGRTSAQNPPIQQTPRSGGIRELFKASEGHVLLILDYSYIELCTLAAVCLARYGDSKLAQVIQCGIDPHSFTASMMEGIEFHTFMTWKDHEDKSLRSMYSDLRQKAKAINFGIPSGLSTNGLVQYSKNAYHVEITEEQADIFRYNLINVIYPELSKYLDGNDMRQLSINVDIPEEICWDIFSYQKGSRSPAIEGCVRNVVKGCRFRKKDGKEYNQKFVNRIWKGLKSIITDPKQNKMLEEAREQGSEQLYKELFGRPVVTLTGRVRGKVGYTQACNTPFSGLAADGSKLALWNLYQLNYKVVGFIHDEIIIEIPENKSGIYTEEARKISEIACGSMRELTGPVPITCSVIASKVWSKNAYPVYNENGDLILWENKSSS